ncbi:hypothetical protein Z043_115052 [Scleropages formosus]|uniref:Uncharacterized protein n=1 Tax=Scleropages formosus TaxID=113540 RepID=A0A0N8JYG2_SCLFO|nr:hypothetical protein Z043_115052 [Scleropages formosus]
MDHHEMINFDNVALPIAARPQDREARKFAASGSGILGEEGGRRCCAGGHGERSIGGVMPGSRRSWGALGRCLLLPLLTPCALLSAWAPECRAHPQPCQILKRIGHTVRVGAVHLQPRVLGEGDTDGGRKSILLAVETLNRMADVLPFNLSLEVVMAVETGLGELPAFSFASSSTRAATDPVSFLQSVCHTVVVQGVSAMMAFPQSRGELLELEFVSTAETRSEKLRRIGVGGGFPGLDRRWTIQHRG